MNCRPIITVIIPLFNSSQHLERCLDSILNQSVKDIEIIAVDDLSTDNTVDILEDYTKRFKNISLIKLTDKLLAGGARNAGLEAAKGEYISFIDSDDWIDSNFFYYLLDIITVNDLEIAICGVKREYDNAKNSLVRYKYSTQNIIDGKYALMLLSRMLDQDISISSIVCNKLFQSNFIKHAGLKFLENCLNEDDVFTFNAFLVANKVGITDKTFYHLYQRRNSLSRGFSRKHVDDLFVAFKEIRDMLTSMDKFETLKYCYYAFFEKCLSYLIESMVATEQDVDVVNAYFKYAYSISSDAISINEFIDYCGSSRIINFFA